jgi:uncharacterized membrane protein YfcA
MQTIIATSLTAIALVSAASIFTYLLHGDIKWEIAVPFVTSAIVSMFAFSLISQKIPARISERSFAILAIAAAIMLTAKALTTF